MRTSLSIVLVLAACAAEPDPPPPAPDFGYPLDGTLRLNQLQLAGTHNSYHQRPEPARPEWDYSHAPLDVQLEAQGVRQFELDVHWDPNEERYTVFHVPIVDDRSSCHYLSDCLGLIRGWSDAHRGHQPLFIFLEPKDDLDAEFFGPGAVIAPHLDDLDKELRAAWPDRRLEPDDVRGRHQSLREAIATDGWPTLGSLRGHALFVLLDSSRWHGGAMFEYTNGLADLNGRAMFTLARANDSFASILSQLPADQSLNAVKQGFIVRDLVDDGHGAEIETTYGRDDALAGVAHIISSDYPAPGILPGYDVSLPGGTPSRCHPLLAPAGCTSADIESPERLQPR